VVHGGGDLGRAILMIFSFMVHGCDSLEKRLLPLGSLVVQVVPSYRHMTLAMELSMMSYI